MKNLTAETVAAVEAFVRHCQKVVDDNNARMAFPWKTTLTIDPGSRYVKIVKTDSQSSVYGFIDVTNGDILKAATWKAPAKIARGNVNNPATWNCAGPYGMAYLR